MSVAQCVGQCAMWLNVRWGLGSSKLLWNWPTRCTATLVSCTALLNGTSFTLLSCFAWLSSGKGARRIRMKKGARRIRTLHVAYSKLIGTAHSLEACMTIRTSHSLFSALPDPVHVSVHYTAWMLRASIRCPYLAPYLAHCGYSVTNTWLSDPCV